MSNAITRATETANHIGRAAGVVCKYEWCQGPSGMRFQWNFYRHGRRVASTVQLINVVRRMESLVEPEKERAA